MVSKVHVEHSRVSLTESEGKQLLWPFSAPVIPSTSQCHPSLLLVSTICGIQNLEDLYIDLEKLRQLYTSTPFVMLKLF